MNPGADYKGSGFYCDVALRHRQELEVVRETEHVLVFRHTRPSHETHVVVAPKKHIDSLSSLTRGDEPVVRELLEVIQAVAADIERSLGAARVVTNLGAYQDSKHLHVHIVSRERRSRVEQNSGRDTSESRA